MARNILFIVIGALVVLGVGAFLLWKTVGNPCSSPISITTLDVPPSDYSGDKSGAKRAKIAIEGNLSVFQYVLEAGKKTRTTYDANEALMIEILEGKGILHSAHFSEKGELIWFLEVPVEEGNLLSIPPNIAYQLEAPEEGALRYLTFSLKGSQTKDRLFLRDEHPSSFPCKQPVVSVPQSSTSEDTGTKANP